MNINLGSYNIVVKIVNKNNKNIYLRFNEDAVLVVTCPNNTSETEIRHLIEKNASSIVKMYENAIERKKYSEEFWLLGKKYIVVFNDEIDDTNINGEHIYTKDEKHLEKFLEEEINRVFKEEIDICRNCFNNLPDIILKTRQMRTRWGVCNRKTKTITLNKELIKKDINLIDYVILHEMAHFYEGNHSRKFWDIVQMACPDYKQRRALLKK